MTDAVEIALIGAGGAVVSGALGIAVIILMKRLEVKVDGRLTELLKANKRADTAQGRQDERDSRDA
jgi:hypothetical protein